MWAPQATTGWPGKNGASSAVTPIGPIPGPLYGTVLVAYEAFDDTPSAIDVVVQGDARELERRPVGIPGNGALHAGASVNRTSGWGLGCSAAACAARPQAMQ